MPGMTQLQASRPTPGNEPRNRHHVDPCSSCVRFADLDGSGEHKLVIADFDKKLKIYAGTVHGPSAPIM